MIANPHSSVAERAPYKCRVAGSIPAGGTGYRLERKNIMKLTYFVVNHWVHHLSCSVMEQRKFWSKKEAVEFASQHNLCVKRVTATIKKIGLTNVDCLY